jgi:hypothetical protein
MGRRTKTVLYLALAIIAVFAVYHLFRPLAVFTRHISQADHAIVTFSLNNPPPVSLTITGEHLQALIKMVSSTHRDAKPYDCSPVAEVKFLKTAELLGQMTVCSQLIWLKSGQYRDDSGLLDKLIVTPLLEAKSAWADRKDIPEYIAAGPRLTNGLLVVKLSVFQDGRVLLDGKEASLADVDVAVGRCRASTGVVWWYNEPHTDAESRPRILDDIGKLIVERCDFRISGQTNFSDLVAEQRETRALLERLNK